MTLSPLLKNTLLPTKTSTPIYSPPSISRKVRRTKLIVDRYATIADNCRLMQSKTVKGRLILHCRFWQYRESLLDRR
jgi:hypothetical protein